MKTVAIVAGAGFGKRLGLKVKKPFIILEGKPLIMYCVHVLDTSPLIDGIIVALERSCVSRFKRLVKKYGLKKVKDIVIGGRTRFESVCNCLERVNDSYDVVLIHDAARPFINHTLVQKSIAAAKQYGGCVVAVPENDTVKLADGDLFVERTLDRSHIWRAQTPQVFMRSVIIDACRKMIPGRVHVTDDSSLVERAGNKVRIVSGFYNNIKITTREDLAWAKELVKLQRGAS